MRAVSLSGRIFSADFPYLDRAAHSTFECFHSTTTNTVGQGNIRAALSVVENMYRCMSGSMLISARCYFPPSEPIVADDNYERTGGEAWSHGLRVVPASNGHTCPMNRRLGLLSVFLP